MTRHIRPIRIEGNIAYVPLTQGYEAVIDAADVPLVAGRNWYALVARNTVYAVQKDYSTPKQRTVYMHRIIMGEPDGFEVDHIESHGLDNRRSNLRVATRSQNQHNQRLSKANTSGLKGVSWCKRDRKWRSCIKSAGQRKHLGYFSTLEDAHAAYCKASAKLHGEFSRTE